MDRIPELRTYPSWSRFVAPRPVVRCFLSIRISARIETRTLHNKQRIFFTHTTRSLYSVDANLPITTATNFSQQNFLIILYGSIVIDFYVINLSIVYAPSLSVFQTHVCNACCATIDDHSSGQCIGSTTSVWKMKRWPGSTENLRPKNISFWLRTVSDRVCWVIVIFCSMDVLLFELSRLFYCWRFTFLSPWIQFVVFVLFISIWPQMNDAVATGVRIVLW